MSNKRPSEQPQQQQPIPPQKTNKKFKESAQIKDGSTKQKQSRLGGLSVVLQDTTDWYNQQENEVPSVTTQSNTPFPCWSLYLNEPFIENHDALPLVRILMSLIRSFFYSRIKMDLSDTVDLISSPSKPIHISWTCFDSEPHLESLMHDQPTFLISCLGIAISAVFSEFQSLLDLPTRDHIQTKRSIRIHDYPKVTLLKDIKANLIGKFISIKGTIVKSFAVKPIVKQMTFICITCNAFMIEKFPDGKFKSPTKCSTFGCKSRTFAPDRSSLNKTQTVDWQRIRIQEKLSEDQADDGRIPRHIDCELMQDLVDSVIPGDVVFLSGIIKVLSADEGKAGKMGTQMYQLYLDTNCLYKASSNNKNSQGKQGSKDNIQFSKKDLYGIQDICEIRQHGGDLFKLLVHSLCPQIFGHEMVKAGLLLVLFGGTNESDLSVKARSNPHILVVGDPGLGKSQMLSATCRAAPRGVYVCGNTATTSGLTVTVGKDPDTGDVCLEAGALVLGDQGICCIDEFDKMTEHQALLEAMEQQSISIAKAGIVCNLPARTSVIAAANPVGGHYNKAKSVSENLKLNSALLSRFDLIFILMDNPDVQMDRFLSEHILKLHASNSLSMNTQVYNNKNVQKQSQGNSQELELQGNTLAERLIIHSNEEFHPIPVSLLQKYMAYARLYSQPRLSSEAANLLKNFYLTLRKDYRSIDSTPITTRQLESMIRLCEAKARSELRQIILESDARDVIEIMKFSLWETYQNDKGVLDFSRSQHGTGMSKKNQVKRFISELQRIAQETSNNRFTFDNLYKIASQMRLEYDRFEDLVDSLNNQGFLLKCGNRIYKLGI